MNRREIVNGVVFPLHVSEPTQINHTSHTRIYQRRVGVGDRPKYITCKALPGQLPF